jgi:hypothetical protein
MLMRMWGKRNPHTLLVGMQVSTTTMENSMKTSQKLKIDLPYDTSIPLLGIYLKEYELGYNKGSCTSLFIAVVLSIVKLWEQPRCPTTDEWIRKLGIYIQ